MSSSSVDTVVWTLTRLRTGRHSLWFSARATCAHGASDHTLVAPSLDLVRDQLPGLGQIHRAQRHCRCTTVELVVQE